MEQSGNIPVEARARVDTTRIANPAGAIFGQAVITAAEPTCSLGPDRLDAYFRLVFM